MAGLVKVSVAISLLSCREECVNLYATGGVEGRASEGADRTKSTIEDAEDTKVDPLTKKPQCPPWSAPPSAPPLSRPS